MSDIHSARHHFLQVVLPAYEQFGNTLTDGIAGDHRDLLAAGRAAEACLNLADHLATDPTCRDRIPGAPKSKSYVTQLTKQYDNFAIIRDIANAFKHRVISRVDRTIDSIDSVKEHVALIRFTDSEGYYYASRKLVIVSLRDGRRLYVGDVLFGCIGDWMREMLRLNQIPSALHIKRLPPRLLRRQDVLKQPCIEMRAEQGEYFESNITVLEYYDNNDTYGPVRGKMDKVDFKMNWSVAPSRFGRNSKNVSP